MTARGPVLYFDGVCNVCNASVHFVLDHERDATLQFASLQSPDAEAVLPPLGIDPKDLDSLVVVIDGKAYGRSTAALMLTKYLKAPWCWLSIFMWVPRPIRDFFYKAFAVNRYRFFGKKEACMVPTPALRARFLDLTSSRSDAGRLGS